MWLTEELVQPPVLTNMLTDMGTRELWNWQKLVQTTEEEAGEVIQRLQGSCLDPR